MRSLRIALAALSALGTIGAAFVGWVTFWALRDNGSQLGHWTELARFVFVGAVLIMVAGTATFVAVLPFPRRKAPTSAS